MLNQKITQIVVSKFFDKHTIDSIGYNFLTQILLLLSPITINIYTIRTVGVDTYGHFVFYQAFFLFFSIFLNTGFSQDGLRDLSKTFHDHSLFSHCLSTLISAKLIYLCLSCLICCFIYFIFDDFHSLLFLCCCSYLIYYFFDFSILYQAIYQVNIFLKIVFFSTISSISLVLLFLHTTHDIYLIPLCITFPYIIFQSYNLFFFIRKKNIELELDLYHGIGKIKNNFTLMIANFLVLGYTKGVFLILGLCLDMKSVGIFSIAEQIYRAFLAVINRIAISFSPILVQELEEKKYNQVFERFKKIFLFIIFLSLCSIAMIVLSGKEILIFFLHSMNYITAYNILLISSWNIFFISVSSLCAVQFFINNNNNKIFFKYSVVSSLLGLPFIGLSVHYFDLYGAIISYSFVEFSVMVYFLLKFFLFFKQL